MSALTQYDRYGEQGQQIPLSKAYLGIISAWFVAFVVVKHM